MEANEIANLTAAIEKMTAAVEKASAATSMRLSEIEARLAAVESAKRGALDAAIERVSAIEGAGAIRERLDEVLVRLVDPETLDSLARVVVLAPKLEYALQAVAAGPELLEEGLDVVKSKTNGSADQRLRVAVDAAAAVTAPRTLAGLAHTAVRAADLSTTIDAAAGAVAALEGAHGKDVMHARIAELFTTLGDPETIESLTRMAALAPKLEYAMQAAAAGPELLEEGLDVIKSRTGGSMDDRLRAALDAAATVSAPKTIGSLSRTAVKAAEMETAIDAAAGAFSAIENAYGKEAMHARIAELCLALGDPETMESLTRIASLAPKLEYAAQAAAAGPELLEEALAFVKHETAARFGDKGALDARVRAATEAAMKITEPGTIAPLASMASASAKIAPIVSASADAIDRVAQVEGREAMERRVSEAVIALTDGETMESLTRVVALLPRIEYAVQALAAGPELLEEALGVVRAWSKEKLGAENALDQRLKGAADALVVLTQPSMMTMLTKSLPDLLAAPGLMESLPALVRHAPRLGTALDRALGAFDKAIAREEIGASDLEARLEEGIALLLDLSEPKKLTALRRATKLVTMVDEALGDLDEEDAERGAEQLAEVIAALGRPETLEGMRVTLDMLPRLSETIAALPVQPHTLELLRTANEAIEEASVAPTPIGMWGMMRALGEPEVQAALGLGIGVARRIGSHVNGVKPKALLRG